MDLLKEVSSELVEKKEWPEFQAGDTITVYYDIKEGEKGLHAENVIPVGNNVKKNAIGNFDDDRLSGENNFCPNLSMIY